MLPASARWVLITAPVFTQKGAEEHDKGPDAEPLWHFQGAMVCLARSTIVR